MLRTRLVAGVTSGFVLSAVFATVLTIARFGDAFVEASRVEPGQPAPVTLRLPPADIWEPDGEYGALTRRTLEDAILRGSIVREEPLASWVSAYEDERRPPRTTRLAAQWFVYFLITLMTAAYMRRAGSDRAGLLRAQVSLFMLTLLLLVGAKVMLLLTDLPPYMLPVATVPLWAALYVDRRTGIVLSLMVSVCATSLLAYDPVVLAVYTVSATAATLSFRTRKRIPLVILSSLLGGLLGGVVYVAAQEIHQGLDVQEEWRRQLYAGPVSALVGGLASGVLAYLLHAPVARLLGIVSRSELLYLSDLEQPLLQHMAERAPGSWEHSRMMANLAEAAAASIGADALLTRVGAYYHDLGKSVQPKYFVENLRRGETSPHGNLEPEVSADAIMAHVVEGVRILREGGIPEPVVEFAYTHHGTSVIEFFWHKCKKDGNPRGLGEQAFRYPGMRPRTKETGILMLIDAIEAGARTVDPPNRKKFSELVRRVIFTKLQQGQLDESGLTLAELRTVTNRIIDTLCSAYHSRIRYPWQEAEAKLQGADAQGAQGPVATTETTATPSNQPDPAAQASAAPATAAVPRTPQTSPSASATPAATEAPTTPTAPTALQTATAPAAEDASLATATSLAPTPAPDPTAGSAINLAAVPAKAPELPLQPLTSAGPSTMSNTPVPAPGTPSASEAAPTNDFATAAAPQDGWESSASAAAHASGTPDQGQPPERDSDHTPERTTAAAEEGPVLHTGRFEAQRARNRRASGTEARDNGTSDAEGQAAPHRRPG